MSQKFPGGFITKSPVAPTTTAASGVWTLDQQQQYQKAGTWPAPPIFIEDLFSTYLYTGTGSTQTITNGIDLSANGGLVWFKGRNTASNNRLYDTARGMTAAVGGAPYLYSNDTAGNLGTGFAGTVVATSSGFDITQGGIGDISDNGSTYASWTFRKQPKFFDVVTYTGDNTASKAISHNLGSVPGCVIVKRTDSGSHWFVWHRSTSGTPNNDYTLLNQTAATAVATNAWSSNAFTSTEFYVSNNLSTNVSGATYVAYLFAHNAGGFPASGGGSTNGISCGSYTGNGSASGPTVTLGYEPQWVLVKRTDSTSNWTLSDNMRGQPVDGATAILYPNSSDAEASATTAVSPTATGFQVKTSGATYNASGGTYIYIAIRRGPMKVPTDATKVFGPTVQTAAINSTTPVVMTPAASDLWFSSATTSGVIYALPRLTGFQYLVTSSTDAEQPYTWTNKTQSDLLPNFSNWFSAGTSQVNYFFKRAPSFFDEVCYTANNGAVSPYAITHNLTVVPELIIVKNRSTGGTDWAVYSSALGNNKVLFVNSTAASSTTSATWATTTPTATYFYVGNSGYTNLNFDKYVAYLFATCAGVSKVGSYTGTGALQTINCGFTSGARFVLIKRTDSTGDWYTYDSARGITSGNDPYLLLNSAAAEVTGTNYVDTDTTGFQVTAAAPAGLNANGGTYIFLAIA